VGVGGGSHAKARRVEVRVDWGDARASRAVMAAVQSLRRSGSEGGAAPAGAVLSWYVRPAADAAG